MSYEQNVIYIHRFLTGEMDVVEQQKFDAWLEQDLQNRKLFSELSMIWEKSVLPPTLVFDTNSAKARFKERISKTQYLDVVDKAPTQKVFYLRPLLAVAASLILIMAVWFVFSRDQGVTFNASQNAIANLEDGSKVWMDNGSSIKYIENNKKRKVVLEGKAHFDVVPKKQKPFIITTDGFEIEVLGTSFTVDGITKSIFVKHGKVKVTFKDKEILLTDNNFLQLDENKLTPIEHREFSTEDLWFNENLTFNNTPFDKAIEDISAYFNINFDIPTGRDWSECGFTSGSLKNNTIDEVITTLRLTYELDCVKISDKSYKISRVKCKKN